MALREDFEIVHQRTHPRLHLFFLGAGQEADVLAEGNGDAGHDDFIEALAVERLGEPCCQRHQGLAGAGGAEHGHEVDIRVHQQVEREVLFAIARGDAPDVVAIGAEVLHELKDRGVVFDAPDDRLDAVRRVLVNEQVRVPVSYRRPAQPVERPGMFLPRRHVVAVPLPEVRRQRLDAAVQEIGVLDGLVAEVVLGMHADDRGLDPQVDVLRDERDPGVRPLQLERERLAENRIVRASPRQLRQAGRQGAGLEVKPAAGRTLAVVAAAGRWQGHALVDGRLRHSLDQLVKEAADLADIAGSLRYALLAGIQFLEDDHRYVDVVFLEAEDRRRVVHQHVGVEHEQGAFRILASLQDGSPQSALSASSTSSACPSTFTLRHSARSTPAESIRNVLRSTPMYFLPYMLFSLITS